MQIHGTHPAVLRLGNGPTIHHLHAEVLVYIFILFNESSAGDKPSARPRGHASHWMPLMLVCRRWREVGCTTPSLWQTIDVDGNSQWLILALERSRKAPLVLHFHSASTALSSIPLVVQHANRVRKLLFPPVEHSDLPSLYALLSTDMPILNELRLWVNERCPGEDEDGDEDEQDIEDAHAHALWLWAIAGSPQEDEEQGEQADEQGEQADEQEQGDEQLQEDEQVQVQEDEQVGDGEQQNVSATVAYSALRFPDLRHLQLSHITFPWELSTISNLRCLHLYRCHSQDASLPFQQFLDVLASSGELKELHLHGFISTLAHYDSTPCTYEVALPRRIRKLVIGDAPSLTALFLSSVVIPSDITLRVIGWIDPIRFHVEGTEDILTSMLPEDRYRLPILQSVTRIKFRAYDDDFHICGTSASGSIALKLRPNMRWEERYMGRWFVELSSIFRGAQVEELDIGCEANTVDSASVWENLLASFPGVRSLRIRPGRKVRPIWNALRSWCFPWESDLPKRRLCPELRELHVEDLYWNEGVLDFVLGCLRRRAMRGLPKLESLNLTFGHDARHGTPKDLVLKEMTHMVPFYDFATYTDHFDCVADIVGNYPRCLRCRTFVFGCTFEV